MKTIVYFITACLLLASSTTIHAQVTIGSLQKPVAGALLDLKEEGTTNKGMMLPRVKLDDPAKLKMGTNEINDADDGGDQYAKHRGLWVYHVSGEGKPQCAAIPDGVYVWDGANWQPIGVTKVTPGTLNLTGGNEVENNTLNIPSGHDSRGATVAQAWTLDWTPTDLELLYTKTDAAANSAPGVDHQGGLTYATPLEAGPFAGGNKVFNVHATPMPAPDPASPWQSRETQFEFEIQNECGIVRKVVKANQTHYAIQVDGSFDNKNIFIKPVVDADLQQFASVRDRLYVPVIGNARWRTKKEADSNGIMGTITAGAADVNNGGINAAGTRSRAMVAMKLNTAGTKYGSTIFTIYDNGFGHPIKRYDDVSVNVMSCLGTVDDSGTLGKDNTHKVANVKIPGLLGPTTNYDIPSGLDGRGAVVPFALSPTWTPATSFAGGANNVAVSNAPSGTLAPVDLNTALPTSLTTQSQLVNISTKHMTAAEAPAANPWFSKESVVKFNVTDDCDETNEKEVILNQTNYALKVNNSFADSNITATTGGTFDVEGNATWRVASDNTSAITSTVTQGGATLKDGTRETQTYPYTLPAAGKYQSANITFSDSQVANKRFNDIKVNILNCNPAGANGITPSAKTIYLPSGADLRPLTPVNLGMTWLPATSNLGIAQTANNGLSPVPFSPALGSSLAASPATMILSPVKMSGINPSAPWQSKETKLTFTDLCGTTEDVIVNQTNKAMIVSTPYKEYAANAPNTTNTLTTNADWKLASIMPNDGTTAISNVRVGSPTANLPTNTTQIGYEQNNNAGKAATLTYDVAVAATKARYSTLTFADASATKRFNDVTITVFQCSNVGQHPTIEQWALTAGFSQIEINYVKATGTDSRKLPTGLQMHRVRNTPRGTDQIFLSSNFGSNPQDDDERWMIHNLDAKAYDGVTHSIPDRPALSGPNGNAITHPSGTAYWAYPKPDGTISASNDASERRTYDNNQRLGLLYTWDAATAGKGGIYGSGNVDNLTFQEGGRREGDAATEQKRRQGICPSGWHLPSDDEWSLLEQNIVTNKSAFSSLATSTELYTELNNIIAPLGVNRPTPATSTDATPNQGWRGLLNNANGHGNAMKEICELIGLGKFKGASNGINSTDRPGFDVFYAGSAHDFGTRATIWSASSGTATQAWSRYFYNGYSQVARATTSRSALISVRCKK